LSVGHDDGDADVTAMVDKLAGLRIFPDAGGRMNVDVVQTGGEVLLISQFTLHGDVRRGKRPAFITAMEPVEARRRVEQVAVGLRTAGLRVAEGVFAADMAVSLCNQGPVTILLDTKKVF
jgi:D-tyrosyl-tRNA(Tyr) deacylase